MPLCLSSVVFHDTAYQVVQQFGLQRKNLIMHHQQATLLLPLAGCAYKHHVPPYDLTLTVERVEQLFLEMF